MEILCHDLIQILHFEKFFEKFKEASNDRYVHQSPDPLLL
jgi:hypothetical protein